MPAAKTRLGRAAVWLLSASCWGCGTFDDPSTVKDLRILAVAAEPSEVIFDVASEADLATVVIPPIVLTPLIVEPAGRPITISVSACANDPAAPSPPNNGTDPTGFPAGGVRATVGSTLCDGAPSQVVLATDLDLATWPLVAATLTPAWLIGAFQQDVFIGPDGHPHGGFDLGMPVVFQLTARAGTETALVVKRAIFWRQPIRADQTANRAPVIPGVRVYGSRDEATAEPLPDALAALDEGSAVPVPAGGLWVEPVAANDPTTTATAETYVTAALDRITNQVTPVDVTESLTYSFYASAGTFSPLETTSQPPPGVTPQRRVHIESKYQPPAASSLASGDVTVWIVVRDERGGSSWVTRTLHVPSQAGP